MYLFVADEAGNPGINSRTSNTYSFGGYVIDESQIEKLNSVWMKIKEKLAEETIYELKWKHFFVELDPLNLNLNQKARRQIAAFILKGLFETATLMPLVSVVRKDKTAGDLVIRTKSGGNKLDENSFWLSTLALFGLFLDRKMRKEELFLIA